MNILNKLLNKFGKTKIIIFLIIILLFALYMFKTSRALRVRYIDLEFEDLPKSFDNIKVALASDIHSGLYVPTSHIKKMSYMIMTNKPDIILFVGDYIYSAPRWFRYYNKKNIIKLNEGIKDLNAPLGKYAVMGNHDNYESKIDISNTFYSNNFKMLDNNIIFITNENKEYISIGGIGDFLTDEVKFDLAIKNVKTNDFNILLSHEPMFPLKIAQKEGYNKFIDFFVAGHTHGLQISFVPMSLFERLNKNRNYPLTTIYGNMKSENMKIYITSGVGAVLLPFRLFAYPEIVIVNLRSKK
ncbi:metallophosphoesterase [Brachyspira aalborgi]|jgi:predicted MPP superfamily phosphohydrolase|uniref:Phosphodiesterase n=1 Tax=Brachyspira aalborgi TaxID=29522 RepID=A0ABY3KBW6_9SPIR|nr:metallophosphoesterase [Brachyspira aalborgi]TXJ34411.1 phosphodiesterase [Brachyspira aalborgi]